MRDSSECLHNPAELRARLAKDGFLLLRGALDPLQVRAARAAMLQLLHKQGTISDLDGTATRATEATAPAPKKTKRASAASASSDGDASASTRSTSAAGCTVDAETGLSGVSEEELVHVQAWKALGWSDPVRRIYAGEPLQQVLRAVFGEQPTHLLSDCTWLRAKGERETTAEHADFSHFYHHSNIFRRNRSAFQAMDPSEGPPPPADWKPSSELRAFASSSCLLCKQGGKKLLMCTVCRGAFHELCIGKQGARVSTVVAKRSKGGEKEWHCTACINRALPFWTCWIPLGDVADKRESRLVVLPGSHTIGGYERPCGNGLLPGAFRNRTGDVWQTPVELAMGDLILFNLRTVHAATRHADPHMRLSIDTRVCLR